MFPGGTLERTRGTSQTGPGKPLPLLPFLSTPSEIGPRGTQDMTRVSFTKPRVVQHLRSCRRIFLFFTSYYKEVMIILTQNPTLCWNVMVMPNGMQISEAMHRPPTNHFCPFWIHIATIGNWCVNYCIEDDYKLQIDWICILIKWSQRV